jgi:hypothetical protein
VMLPQLHPSSEDPIPRPSFTHPVPTPPRPAPSQSRRRGNFLAK